jgi:hypothetical protein
MRLSSSYNCSYFSSVHESRLALVNVERVRRGQGGGVVDEKMRKLSLELVPTFALALRI